TSQTRRTPPAFMKNASLRSSRNWWFPMMSQIAALTVTEVPGREGSSTANSFELSFVPRVEMYLSSNVFVTNRRVREVLPTPGLPASVILRVRSACVRPRPLERGAIRDRHLLVVDLEALELAAGPLRPLEGVADELVDQGQHRGGGHLVPRPVGPRVPHDSTVRVDEQEAGRREVPSEPEKDEEGEEGEEGDAPGNRGIPESARGDAVAEGDALHPGAHKCVIRGESDLEADAVNESRG